MNIFKKLFSKKQPPQPLRRTLSQRMTEAEENIELLWKSFDSLASDMSSLGGRVGALEEKPGIPLPDGYEWQTDENGEEVIVFVGEPLEPLAELEPVEEEVFYDGE